MVSISGSDGLKIKNEVSGRFFTFFSIVVCSVLLLSFLSVSSVHGAEYSEPHWNSSENHYEIDNVQELQWINNDLDNDYVLVSDIDATETRNWEDNSADENVEGFEPIGENIDYGLTGYSYAFIGTFNGNGHVIKNLYENRPDEKWVGLFGAVGENFETDEVAVIENVGLENVDITAGYEYSDGGAGALVGGDFARISNSYSTGVLRVHAQRVGGLVGQLFIDRVRNTDKDIGIDNCYSSVNIVLQDTSYSNWIGGLVGYLERYDDDVTSGSEVKGSLRVVNSHASGNFENVAGLSWDASQLGGFVGRINGTDTTSGKLLIENCYSTGDVRMGKRNVGGFVGEIYGIQDFVDIDNCYSTGDVYAEEYESEKLGGFAGNVGNQVIITRSYSTGNVITYSKGLEIGGFVGRIEDDSTDRDGKIEDSYATGDVYTGMNLGSTTVHGQYLGGFVGRGEMVETGNEYTVNTKIARCYSLGNVHGGNEDGATDTDDVYVGGFSGKFHYDDFSNTNLENCYSAGEVNVFAGDTSVGPFGGLEYSEAYNSFYDKDTVGLDVDNSNVNDPIATGKSHSHMKMEKTFTDTDWSDGLETSWDFENDWGIKEGVSYPYLLNNEPSIYPDSPTEEYKSGSAEIFGQVSPLTTEITLENIDDNIDFGGVAENESKLDIHHPFSFDVDGGGYNVDTYVKGTDLEGDNVFIGVENVERGVGSDPSTPLTKDWALIEGDLGDPAGYTVSENYQLNVPIGVENLKFDTELSGSISVIAIDNNAGDPSTW